MLHFLQPLWLLAAAGTAVPIAIHLWNVKKGRTLKVGSIELLSETARRRSNSLRLTELLLLLLRCLLIVLIALLLAKPYWQSPAGKGWIVMERSVMQQAYSNYKSLVDSLVNAGYTIHAMEEGFPVTALTDTAGSKTDTVSQPSYWKQVSSLNHQLPGNIPVYLFTGNRMSRFKGARPVVAMPLYWKTVTEKDSVAEFISSAYMGSNDSLIVVVGTSSPRTTVYRHETLALNKPEQKGFVTTVSEGRLQLQYRDGPSVGVDTSTLSVTVFSDAYDNDTRYVAAALRSIGEVDQRKIAVHVSSRIDEVPLAQDWLFWLSTQEAPENIQSKHVLRYAKGEMIATRSSIHANGNGSQLYKRIEPTSPYSNVLWSDGFGNPLLVRSDAQRELILFTHFDPSWNDLVWEATFPSMLYSLVYPPDQQEKERLEAADRRVVNETALRVETDTRTKSIPASVQTRDAKASRVIWTLFFILFLLERICSFKTKKQESFA